MAARTTRTDGVPDLGQLDLGYHYPETEPTTLVGDCDGDGRVEIQELILAVNIALGNAPLAQCPSLDANGDGVVGIDELLQAVRGALSS